jgi:hypothetical protein
MFSKGDGYRDVVMCPVTITLTSGVVLSGVLQRPRMKKLNEFLNDGAQFVEVELYDGTITQVSKQAMAHCALRDIPKADQLAASIQRADVFHPIGTLGLDGLKSKEAIQQAYHARVALYHQDKYASVDLPKEVAAYMRDMTVRLNTAYTDALAMLETQRREAAAKAPSPAA